MPVSPDICDVVGNWSSTHSMILVDEIRVEWTFLGVWVRDRWHNLNVNLTPVACIPVGTLPVCEERRHCAWLVACLDSSSESTKLESLFGSN